MDKRLGGFLGLGLVGVVMLLAGQSWDAFLHAADPTLAAREGTFAWRNPGHVLLGLGMGTVVVSLVGAMDAALTMTGSRLWARPPVRHGFLAASTALLVAAGAITSWSAGGGHDDPQAEAAARAEGAADGHPAGLVTGEGATGLAAAPGHGHDRATGTTVARGPVAERAHDPGAVAGEPPVAGGPVQSTTTSDQGPATTTSTPGPRTAAPPESGAAGHGSGHQAARAAPDRAAPPETASSTPATTPAGRATITRYGPFVLTPAGAGGDGDHATIVLPEAPRVCSDCFLLGLEPDLVYADGSPANLDTGVMLHQAVLFQSGRVDVTCANDDRFPGRLGERFFASGNERTRGQLPDGFGYPVGNTSWNAAFTVVNHSSEAKTVFFTLKARWVPASQAHGILPVTPVWMDVGNCGTSGYDVPAGPSSRRRQWTSTITGRVLSAAGHVDEGGLRTTLANATTGQRLCTSWAGYGTKAAYMGSVESMGVCSWDRLGTVRAGEVLDLEAVYEAQAPVAGAMGIMIAYVHETPDLGGGTPAPPDVTGETTPPPTSRPPAAGHGAHRRH